MSQRQNYGCNSSTSTKDGSQEWYYPWRVCGEPRTPWHEARFSEDGLAISGCKPGGDFRVKSIDEQSMYSSDDEFNGQYSDISCGWRCSNHAAPVSVPADASYRCDP